MAERQFTNLFGFQSGVVRKSEMLLEQPENSLTDGKNFDIADGPALLTRRGRVYCSKQDTAANPLPDGEVVFVSQVRLPTSHKTFCVAQVGNKVYACNELLPVQDGTADWVEIYDLSTGKGYARGA